MASGLRPTPAFGQADLSNCEREQIHLAASIQPHGALLLLREPDYEIVQASANAVDYLNLDGDIVGRSLPELCGDLSERINPHLDEPLHTIPIAVQCRLGNPAGEFDGLLHRPADGGLIVELERAGPRVDFSKHIDEGLQKIVAAVSLRQLCDDVATIFKDLTGYDRVMVYRFDDEGHGEVFSEQREPHLEAYLGNRYPASDIPQIARQLYVRNRVRVLVDVDYQPIPLIPRLSPLTGQDLDMSLCFLRSMSPIHTQYLKNMGVGATLVASLVIGGRLWGLIACHHYEPRVIHYETRVVCELLAENIATRIAALESFVQAQAELAVRRLEQRMVEAISREGDWRLALFESPQSLLQPLDANGAALKVDGQVLTTGEVPSTKQLREIGRWLDKQPRAPVLATASLGIDEPAFAAMSAMASGIVAAPISNAPGEYLMWFRPERIRTVTWGGNPFKPVVVGNDPADLSPRRSFSQWHQLVEGTSEPWSQADLMAASLIGRTVADVVLQFRSVRMLIVQDQLQQVSRQVHQSEQPVIVADAQGRILLINDAFQQNLRAGHPHLQWLEDLPQFFTEPERVRQYLRQLLKTQQTWRGEIWLERDVGEPKPMSVRADPVVASPDRLLGFVFVLTDLTERKAADAARRRFQEGIIEPYRGATVRLDTKSDLVYQNLLSAVVGNAQLAALEITDGVDVAHMPELLENVRASVGRTAELLEHLIWHATSISNDED